MADDKPPADVGALPNMRESMRSAPLATSSSVITTAHGELTLTPAPPKVSVSRSNQPRRQAHTEIGAAVLQNSESILLSAAGLLLQIEDKLASLRQQRWNSDESKAVHDAATALYEDLKQKVEAFLDLASKFLADAAAEEDVVGTARSFDAALSEWWDKRHTEVFDIGLFVSALGVCTMLGCGSVVAATICGALVGGKRVTDAIIAVAKGRDTKSGTDN